MGRANQPAGTKQAENHIAANRPGLAVTRFSQDVLVDRLYEATIVPRLWPEILDSIGSLIGCDKAMIYETDGKDVGHFVANAKAENLMGLYASSGQTEFNAFDLKLLSHKSPEFMRDKELLGESKLEDRFYHEFAVPNEAAHATGTAIFDANGDTAIVCFLRAEKLGPISMADVARLNELRPHFARASVLAGHMAHHRAISAVQTLEMLGLPAAALRQRGRLRLANEGFQKLMPDMLYDGTHRLTFVTPAADRSLKTALSEQVSSRSFPVEGGATHPAHVAHLFPLVGQGRDVFSSLDFILVLVPVTAKTNVDMSLLNALFDLTPNEARVARSVLNGQSTARIAMEAGVTVHAVRFHLSNIMAKTGTTRQAELVGLLSSIRTLRPD